MTKKSTLLYLFTALQNDDFTEKRTVINFESPKSIYGLCRLLSPLSEDSKILEELGIGIG